MTQSNVKLERIFVSTLLTLPSLLNANRIEADDIVDAEARSVYRAILSLSNAGKKVTLSSVRTWLVQHAGIADPESAPVDLGPIEPDIAPITEALRRMAKSRRMIDITHRIGDLLKADQMESAKAVIGQLALELSDSSGAEVFMMKELIEHSLMTVQAESGSKGALIAAGQPSLDEAYRLTPGSLLTVGAQTNVGKSTVIMTWLFDMAAKGIPVGLVSVEDPAEDWGVKAVAAIGGVDPARIWQNTRDPAVFERVGNAIATAKDYPFAFSFVADRSIDGVLGRMEHLATHCGARVIAVDYLQAISHRPGKDIRQRIDSTLEELISMAGKLKVALILASQLARPDKGSPFREPNMIDLKESGSIENRSQCVVLLWRKSDAQGEPIHGKIAKVKRYAAGRKFVLIRAKDSGLLREQTESYSDIAM